MIPRLWAVLLGVSLLGILPLSAQPSAPTANTTPPSIEFQKKMKEVFDAFSDKNYDQALAFITEAEKMRPNDPAVINLHGSILVKEEKWQPADEEFDKALQIDPKFFPALFNKAEILNLQKKYPEARAGFQKLADLDPKNELVQYKIYLTYLFEGNMTEAKTRLDKFDFAGTSPAYYYAQAAWLFKEGKGQEAEGYIRSALAIFPNQATNQNIFAEPLIDAGWLKRRDQAG